MFGIFGKKTLTKRGLKKMDALVTGLILGGIVASIYGIKRTGEVREEIERQVIEEGDRHTLGSVLKMLIFGTPIEKETGSARMWRKIRVFLQWNK